MSTTTKREHVVEQLTHVKAFRWPFDFNVSLNTRMAYELTSWRHHAQQSQTATLTRTAPLYLHYSSNS